MPLGFISRLEELRLDFEPKLFQDLSPYQKRLLKKLGAPPPSWMIKGDECHFYYTIDIEYLNGVDKCLGYIEKLLDKGFILKASSKSLITTRCLIQDLLAKMERIEQKYIQTKPMLSASEIRKSKKRAEKRLKEDTERSGVVRGSLHQNPDGGYGIAWAGEKGTLIRLISDES